jgi:hypothetical protein
MKTTPIMIKALPMVGEAMNHVTSVVKWDVETRAGVEFSNN